MTQALKDSRDDQRDQIISDYANGFLCYEEAAAKLMRLGFDKHEAHDFLTGLLEAAGSGSMK